MSKLEELILPIILAVMAMLVLTSCKKEGPVKPNAQQSSFQLKMPPALKSASCLAQRC